jgi:hypothetical protein
MAPVLDRGLPVRILDSDGAVFVRRVPAAPTDTEHEERDRYSPGY